MLYRTTDPVLPTFNVAATAPGFVIALILYAVIGMRYAGGTLEAPQIGTMLETMEASFYIHPLLLLPPVLVIAMVVLYEATDYPEHFEKR